MLITKYYIKSLLCYDEYQLEMEAKAGYSQLQKAERLNETVMIAIHGNNRETIKIQLSKLQKFKQFMDVETFAALAEAALGTHKSKPEVIQIMRALATKSYDLGNLEKALGQISRAERLAKEILKTEQHEHYLYIWLAKVEILLKKLRASDDQADVNEPIKIAKKAVDMAKSIFGEKTIMTNQAMLTYAMTLTRDPTKTEESREQFEKAEALFTVINNEISFREGCNLLFNMLLHYNFMLNDFSTSVDTEKRMKLVQRLKSQAEVGIRQQLKKRALVAI